MPGIAQEVQVLVLTLIMCHLIGDYVLQNDFIAKTKGENTYHMFIHCMLYCLPFTLVFNWWQLIVLYISHVFVDTLKARFNKITYIQDQAIHYFILIILLLFIM